MPPSLVTGPITSEFQAEFEAQTHATLRRRFLWFAGLLGGFHALSLARAIYLFAAAEVDPSADPTAPTPLRHVTLAALTVLVYSAAAAVQWFVKALHGESLLRLTYLVVLLDGLLVLTAKWSGVPASLGLLGILLTHLLASCFLPWTPRQSLQPLVPLVLIDIALTLAISKEPLADRFIDAALTPLIGLPGLFVCWLRFTRSLESHQLRFLQRRYGEVKRELVDARRLHESLFPKPIPFGPLRFRYLYEPMRQIGGDYLYAVESPSPSGRGKRLNVALIDVTGHGIAAALTVNRLCGELERLFAESPDISPGDLLQSINRYVSLTLSTHSIYATALCCRIDPVKDTLEYANAGHPPAFLRGSDGTVEELPSTALILGAIPDCDFEHGMTTHKFAAGDSLIAYTDGAIEARGKDRRMLGVLGLRNLIATGRAHLEGGWPRTILTSLEQFRHGTPEDDTLLVEISRPVGERPSGTWSFKEDASTPRAFVIRDDTISLKP